ncbi:hypothetical protein ACHWQZ_G008932 [Mnemiopsis leidyi]
MDLTFSDAQTISLGVFCFIMTVFGIFGNGTVLYSSIRYNAIRLDRVSLIFVQNLALADMLYTVCVILPQLITYMAGKWVLGTVYCTIMAQVGIIPVSANTITVLAITSHRLRVLLNPFTRTSTKFAQAIVAATWAIAVVPTIIFALYRSKSDFYQNNGRCLSDIYENDAARIPVMLCVGLIVLLPLFSITLFNIILSCIAIRHSRKRMEERANFRALLMVCSLSGLFIVSWTPYVIFTFLKMKSPSVPAALDLLAFHCIFLNSFGNPVLYTITNRRFGAYVKGLVLSMVCTAKKEDSAPLSSSTNVKVAKSSSQPAME